jgi:hypothetical protein
MSAEAILRMAEFVRTSPDFAMSALVGGSSANPEAALQQTMVYRKSADPEMVAKMMTAGAETDVSTVLGNIKCPVLILHRIEDSVVPFSVGQMLGCRLWPRNSCRRSADKPASAPFSSPTSLATPR